jgi:hypothetical protein
MSGASKAVQEAYESLSLVVGADGKEALDVLLGPRTTTTATGPGWSGSGRCASLSEPKSARSCWR